jgi:putative hydrolase of the HAD superfamily
VKIDAVLFDWGGTLAVVDGQTEALKRGAEQVLESLIGQSIPQVVDHMVASAVEAETQASLDPEHREVDLREFMRSFAGKYGLPVADEQLAAAMVTIGRSWVGAALRLVPGVRDMLATLKGMGLRVGLVSNCFIPFEYCLDELRHQNIADLLDHVVISSGVGYRKPSPRIYAEALRGIAANGQPADPTRVLFVGDSPAYDVIAPAGLGMKTAQVASKPGFWPQNDHEQAAPDWRIETVLEVPGILATLR